MYIYQVPTISQEILGTKVHLSTKQRSLLEHLHSGEGDWGVNTINIINKLEDECNGKEKNNRLKVDAMGGLRQTKSVLQDRLLKSQLFSNIHFKCYLHYEVLLNILVKINFSCYAPLVLPVRDST